MHTFTDEELKLIADNGLEADDVAKVLEMFPQELDTAIGHLVGLKEGKGQERNEGFTPPETPTE
jgi:hypothetical protein